MTTATKLPYIDPCEVCGGSHLTWLHYISRPTSKTEKPMPVSVPLTQPGEPTAASVVSRLGEIRQRQENATPQTWPENAEPTPEQLAEWLKACTDEERLNVARQAIEHRERAARCFMLDHDNLAGAVVRNGERIGLLLDENQRLRDALFECAKISGADVSDGPPTWPPLEEWAVTEVGELRNAYDEGRTFGVSSGGYPTTEATT